MRTYKVCSVDQQGHVLKATELHCADDETVLGAAGKAVGRLSLEVWDGERLVGRLMPTAPGTPGEAGAPLPRA